MQVYRAGLKVQGEEADKGRPFRQKTFRMGSRRIDIDKALALAAARSHALKDMPSDWACWR